MGSFFINNERCFLLLGKQYVNDSLLLVSLSLVAAQVHAALAKRGNDAMPLDQEQHRSVLSAFPHEDKRCGKNHLPPASDTSVVQAPGFTLSHLCNLFRILEKRSHGTLTKGSRCGHNHKYLKNSQVMFFITSRLMVIFSLVSNFSVFLGLIDNQLLGSTVVFLSRHCLINGKNSYGRPYSKIQNGLNQTTV